MTISAPDHAPLTTGNISRYLNGGLAQQMSLNDQVAGQTAFEHTMDLPLGLGTNLFYFTVNDLAGNTATASLTVVYSTGPTITFSPSATIYTNKSDVHDWTMTIRDVAPLTTGNISYFVNGTLLGRETIDDLIGGQTELEQTWGLVTAALGTNTWVYVVNDSAGNTLTFSRTIIYDTTKPVVSIVAPGPGTWCNTSSPKVSWSASDDFGLAFYWVSVDGGGWTNVTTMYTVLSGLQDGHHTVKVRAYDRAGNFNETERSFSVEVTPPTLSILTSIAPLLNTSEVRLEWSATSLSGVVGYWTLVDSGAWTDEALGTNRTFVLADGNHSITVRVKDLAGNWNQTSVSFVVDTTPPTLTINAPANGTHYNVPAVTVNWSATDPGTGVLGYRYRLDGGAWSTISAATDHTFTGLSEGAHTVEIEVVDQVNNSVSANVTFVVDISSPVVTITVPTSNATYATNTSALAISGTGSDNRGIIEVTWTNSRGGSGTATVSGGNWSIAAIALQEGNNIITITARDASNNTAVSTLTVTYTPDTVGKAASPGLDVVAISIIMLVILAGIVAAVFLVQRRKK